VVLDILCGLSSGSSPALRSSTGAASLCAEPLLGGAGSRSGCEWEAQAEHGAYVENPLFGSSDSFAGIRNPTFESVSSLDGGPLAGAMDNPLFGENALDSLGLESRLQAHDNPVFSFIADVELD
jgi:hypothetical protein